MLFSNQTMNMILLHRNSADSNGESLLRFSLASEPVAGVILDGLCKHGGISRDSILRLFAKRSPDKTFFAVPEEWEIEPFKSRHQNRMPGQSLNNAKPSIIGYKDNITIPSEHLRRTELKGGLNQWFVVSNGRYATQINADFLNKVLAGVKADIVAVNANPGLLGQRENVRLTTEGKVAGFCRAYSDSAEFTFVSAEWPHHLFIKTDVLDRVLTDGALPLSFSALSDICRSKGIILRAVNLGGILLDLETEDGLLDFCDTMLSKIQNSKSDFRDSNTISEDAKLAGKVLLGENIQIGPKAVIIGPTIIGNGARIENGVIVNSSIIGPEVCVPANQFVQRRIIREAQINWQRPIRYKSKGNLLQDSHGQFRTWPGISYARCFKRIADFFAAAMVLILFAPVLILVALAIKLTSPGPVFYKDRRQGLHGKEFSCLKFRTMILGADKIQDILRIVSQVDGPQFKIADDPRINTVGWFLRETYIDEIPQFINVLFGQMSIVGPRPSPKSENTLCPFWRDARLSVRPGITGLWQVYRTRQPMKDFQEWIHYDVEYVRNLSLRMDLSICWKTVMKLLGNFIDQF
ncbi:MAG: sugar transferase [Planctomycetota bacterium]|jgi:lipopolysaccharide/colanic/teichoic acid biosynthesis glycosyltransferase